MRAPRGALSHRDPIEGPGGRHCGRRMLGMRASVQFGTIAAIVIALLALRPLAVLADCAPACGEASEEGLDALGVVLLVVVLTAFAAVMSVGGRHVRKDRRSGD